MSVVHLQAIGHFVELAAEGRLEHVGFSALCGATVIKSADATTNYPPVATCPPCRRLYLANRAKIPAGRSWPDGIGAGDRGPIVAGGRTYNGAHGRPREFIPAAVIQRAREHWRDGRRGKRLADALDHEGNGRYSRNTIKRRVLELAAAAGQKPRLGRAAAAARRRRRRRAKNTPKRSARA